MCVVCVCVGVWCVCVCVWCVCVVCVCVCASGTSTSQLYQPPHDGRRITKIL